MGLPPRCPADIILRYASYVQRKTGTGIDIFEIYGIVSRNSDQQVHIYEKKKQDKRTIHQPENGY